jgi:hypothetical protein
MSATIRTSSGAKAFIKYSHEPNLNTFNKRRFIEQHSMEEG